MPQVGGTTCSQELLRWTFACSEKQLRQRDLTLDQQLAGAQAHPTALTFSKRNLLNQEGDWALQVAPPNSNISNIYKKTSKFLLNLFCKTKLSWNKSQKDIFWISCNYLMSDDNVRIFQEGPSPFKIWIVGKDLPVVCQPWVPFWCQQSSKIEILSLWVQHASPCLLHLHPTRVYALTS